MHRAAEADGLLGMEGHKLDGSLGVPRSPEARRQARVAQPVGFRAAQ